MLFLLMEALDSIDYGYAYRGIVVILERGLT